MLTQPRTVCACQPGAFMISARVAPLARFIIAISSAFLVGAIACGLRALLDRWFGLLRDFRFLGRLSKAAVGPQLCSAFVSSPFRIR
jgi:hypothetical protein